MAEQARAELDVDTAGGMAEHVRAQRRQHALEDVDHDQPDDEDVQRRQALVDEHLVHHDLEEQRRHQCEQLQEQRDQQHLADQLAVAHDAGHEPGEVELRERAGQRGAAREQDQLARPGGDEVVEGLGHRTIARRLRQRARRIALSQHAHAAVAHQRQRGHRRQRQALRVTPHVGGLQAEMLRAQQQVGDRQHLAAALAEEMQQCLRIARDVVQARDDAQRQQQLRRRCRCDACDGDVRGGGSAAIRTHGRRHAREGFAGVFSIHGTPSWSDFLVALWRTFSHARTRDPPLRKARKRPGAGSPAIVPTVPSQYQSGLARYGPGGIPLRRGDGGKSILWLSTKKKAPRSHRVSIDAAAPASEGTTT